VEDPAGAALLDPALKLPVVPVIGGVGDPKVVGAGVWEVVNPRKRKTWIGTSLKRR